MADVLTADRTIRVMNPATGEWLMEFAPATADAVNAAVAAARSSQTAWAATPVAERVAVLRKFQRSLHEQKDEVAALITDEAGKPRVESLLAEVLVTLDAANFCAREAPRLLALQRVPHANLALKAKRGYLVREPYGVIGIISPWNYPFSIPASETMAALVTGNAVVLKPSELTPLSALRLKALMDEAGLPAGVLQVVVGDSGTGAALVASAIDKLIFTGSVATGKKIAEAAAAKLMPVVLELGGKDPMIVLADADVEIASSAAVWGAFMNAGQTCLSVERCYVQKDIYPVFVERCVEKAKRLKVGHGSDPQSDVGPAISQAQLRAIEAQVQDAASQGARIVTGGHRLPDVGENFYAPTVLVDVHHGMRVMREETFGPVLPIMPFTTDDASVALANDSQFGLSASVWTKDRKRGEALARRIEAGTVMVNDAISCFGVSEAPHGGVKSSGLGRTHGIAGLEEMVRAKYIDSDLLPGMAKVWWYGYGSDFLAQMQGFTDFLFARRTTARLAGGMKAMKAFSRRNRF
ncbi:MAG TPA: aldehyde dehydrogenase family protein [Terriglobales bacterium]|nr:aldehyde dehydrogenase family protein [Terriglobales bacterium]